MKSINSITKLVTRSTLLLALAALAWLPVTGFAQEKGAERLMKLNRLNNVADVQKVQAGDTIVMSCPKCKDTWAKVVQPMGKGGRQETASVQRHACPGCDTKIVTEGVGKQAQNKVLHTCKQCGSEEASCCVMKKGAGPTPGMDEHKNHNN
jgi:hypothetical protein